MAMNIIKMGCFAWLGLFRKLGIRAIHTWAGLNDKSKF